MNHFEFKDIFDPEGFLSWRETKTGMRAVGACAVFISTTFWMEDIHKIENLHIEIDRITYNLGHEGRYNGKKGNGYKIVMSRCRPKEGQHFSLTLVNKVGDGPAYKVCQLQQIHEGRSWETISQFLSVARKCIKRLNN